MKKAIMKFLSLMILVSVLIFNSSIKASAQVNDIDFEFINNYLEKEIEKAHIPGMAIIVVDKDEVLYSNTYGVCESEDQPFILGSLSKSFTAAAIMQLKEQGKVDLDEKISEYLPQVDKSKDVTVRQLLNQNSGMGAYQSQEDLDFSGEKKFVYANSNYGLLGQIIENVSGTDYKDYIENNIFKPLNMNHSYADYEEAKTDGLIDGYRNYFGFMVNQKYKYPEKYTRSVWSVPAGYLISSSDDMGKYLQMYLNDGENVLNNESINSMFEDNIEAGDQVFYGMGWEIDKRYDETVYKHSGLTENYITYMFILPERGIAVSILVNCSDIFVANNMIGYINHSLICMMMGITPVENSSKYATSHILIDICMLVFVLLCSLPIILLKIRKNKISNKFKFLRIFIDSIVHLLLPCSLLLLPKMLGINMEMVHAFAPDVFIVLILGTGILFVGGILKVIRKDTIYK